MWRVRGEGEAGAGGALAEVERPQAAVFYDRDCYLALYTYHAPTGDQSILYYWMVSGNIVFMYLPTWIGDVITYWRPQASVFYGRN